MKEKKQSIDVLASHKKRQLSGGAASREKLLEAAERLILDQGLHSLTTRNLSSLANVNVSMISYNFDGIDGLLTELFDLNFDKFMSRQVLLLSELQLKEREPNLKDIVKALILSIWHPPVYCQDGHSSTIVQEIYGHASANVQNKATERLKNGFEPVLNLLGPLLPHLSRQALLWRLCSLFAATITMVPSTPLWELYKSLSTPEMLEETLIVDSMVNFGVAALA